MMMPSSTLADRGAPRYDSAAGTGVELAERLTVVRLGLSYWAGIRQEGRAGVADPSRGRRLPSVTYRLTNMAKPRGVISFAIMALRARDDDGP